jgi:hypothetical protein
MTTEPMPVTVNPSELVRPLHLLLTHELGLVSPLGKAVEALDRAASLGFNRAAGARTARTARHALARAVALGERDFDESAIREFDAGRVWISDGWSPNTVAGGLADAVTIEAKRAAGDALMQHGAGIFDLVAAEARRVIGIFEALPEPPRNLFGGGDAARLLTSTAGHEMSYSIILRANSRFGSCTNAANLVRGPAGYGIERFPDGAGRLAFSYRNWRRAMEQANDLRITIPHLRLWRTVVDGWEPGIWKPEEIETGPADRTFSARLRNFNAAVGIPTGKPA